MDDRRDASDRAVLAVQAAFFGQNHRSENQHFFRSGLVLKPRVAKCRKEDDVIVFSLSTENAAGIGGGTEEATLRDKIAGRDQNGAKGAAGQDIQKYCLIAV